jgi:hypothetical protein
MNIYLNTFLALVCMYLAYLWGRKLTRVEIAAEAARNTLNRLEKEGFMKYEVNKKTGEKEFVRFP